MQISIWNEFRQFFISCCKSQIENYEDKQFAGEFWRILWRLKDDTVHLHKTAEMADKVMQEFYMLDSIKTIISLQAILLIDFLKNNLISCIFSNFYELVQSNERYVKYILYKNRKDSSFLWVIQHGDKIFSTKDAYLNESQKIWSLLKNSADFQGFSEKEAKEIAEKYYNYFRVVSEFADGLESYIDRLFEGTKREERESDYLEVNRVKTNLPELKNQIEFVNDLFKSHYYDLIPFKIRLIIEFIVNRILNSKAPSKITNNFNQNIKNLIVEYQGKKFLIQGDIERLNKLRQWGNFTVHDIFPAISKQELIDRQKIILRLINELIKLDLNLFNV